MNLIRKRPRPMRCERIELLPDLVAVYEVKSQTFKRSYYHPCIDMGTGAVDCHCMDFDTRHFPMARDSGVEITTATPMFWCKHIRAMIFDCLVRGEMRVVINHARVESLSAEAGADLAGARR